MRTINDNFTPSPELTIHLRFFSSRSAMCVPELVCMDDSDCVLFHMASRTLGANPDLAEWERVQNYAAFTDDSSDRVIELAIGYDGMLQGINGIPLDKEPAPYTQRLGVPESIVAKPGRHDVVIRLSTTKAQFFFDGVLVDEDAVIGYPAKTNGRLVLDDNNVDTDTRPSVTTWEWALTDSEIAGLSGGENSIAARRVDMFGLPTANLQYWTPPGHNWWVGDTMCFYHEGRFHLFWLNARRHHTGKSGAGGHWFEHCSTTDLQQWEHHPVALDIDEQWEELGTGNCIYDAGQYRLFYGMHTSRLAPEPETTVRRFRDARENGTPSTPVPFGENGKLPSGTALALSEDGIHFKKTRINIHEAENPFVFRDPKTGKFHMIAGYGARGRFESTDLKHWKWVDPVFYPLKDQTPAGNSGECMCFFEWNGWYYLIGGRTGFWMSRDLTGPYWNAPGAHDRAVKPAWDIYDGLQVPEVGAYGNNRRILAGNLPAFGYGGTLVFRELVQHEDGNLGTKWPREMIPPHEVPSPPCLISLPENAQGNANHLSMQSDRFAFAAFELGSSDVLITMGAVCEPGTEAFGFCIAGAKEHDETLELRCEPERGRVLCDTPCDGHMAEDTPIEADVTGHLEQRTSSGIANVTGLARPCKFAIITKYERKSRSTIVDLCVDNRRTLITRRRNLSGIELRVFVRNGAVTFSDIRTAPLL